MRKQQTLKRASANVAQLRENARVREIWAADCETDPATYGRIPRPFVWGCYNGVEYHRFDKTQTFLEFITERKCTVYAHNGGKFDWHYIVEYMEAFSPIMVIAGRIAKFNIGQAEFRDSYNIMPMPLKAGGAKYEIDLSILEKQNRDKPECRREIEERLRTDCLYLFAMLEKFFSEFGMSLTIGTASMNAWAKIANIEKPDTTADFYKTFEPYYFGGRVEAIEPGITEGRFAIIDKNSAYPHAMMSKHPWGDTYYDGDTLPESRDSIARSFIDLTCDAHGAFPYRDPKDHSLTFPADGQERTFSVTGWEYLAAVESGTLFTHKVSRVVQLPLTIDFRSYLDFFYKMKTDAAEAGDAARYEFAKKFLNSLYGKFGANPENYREYKIVQPRYIEAACEADGFIYNGELGPWALLSRPLYECRQRFYNVAVAASITGYVRAEMWRALRHVTRPLYCDTDSIHCADTGSLELHETRLGAWKMEAICDFGAIAGRKLYACRTTDQWRQEHSKCKMWKTASKGVKLLPDEIVRIARGESIIYKPEFPQYSVMNGIKFQTRKIRRTA